MRTILLIIFTIYLTVDFMGTFVSWTQSKSIKEYWWRFADTLISAGMILVFIKLVEILSEVG